MVQAYKASKLDPKSDSLEKRRKLKKQKISNQRFPTFR
jgi:hypothetical protein